MSLRTISFTVVVIALASVLHAQQTTTSKEAAGPPQVTTSTMTGEAVWVQGNLLVCKMQPNGDYRLFDVQPGRQFMIDGQPKLINELKMGTVLTATVTTTTNPITVRTTTVTNGTVRLVVGSYVVLRLENGQIRDYTVPPEFKVTVDGKPVAVSELKVGMRITATKIVEEPKAEISTQTVVTGKAPK